MKTFLLFAIIILLSIFSVCNTDKYDPPQIQSIESK